ncbi:MAG TPA: thiamine diphosphokinase [bacterium]|nr:thiamine diphosphokinase [bacterium]
MESADIGLLLVGGEGPGDRLVKDLKVELDAVDFVIAADSGFDLAQRLKVEPDLLVGDLDSVSRSVAFKNFPTERIKSYNADKDETDTEIGLRIFAEMGCRRVMLFGGGGGRLDHLLGIVSLFERDFYPYVWYTAREHVQLVEGTMAFGPWSGQTVSFFPLGNGVEVLLSKGLKWPLDGLSWKKGDVGISNVIVHDRAMITISKGRLLMIRTLPYTVLPMEYEHG